MKIFIADDSVLICRSLAAVLEDIPGVKIVGQASRVDTAVQGIVKTTPQMVILDIHMPPTTGIDVLVQVKRMANPPIVAVFTENDFSDYRRKCAEAGADYFFVKSINQDDLIELVRRLAAEGT